MYKRAPGADSRKQSQRGPGARTASQALGGQASARPGPTRPPMPGPGLGGGRPRSPQAPRAPRCPGDLSLPGARNKMVGHAPSGFASLLSRARKPWACIAAASLTFEAGRRGEARGSAGRRGEARGGAGRLTQTAVGRPELRGEGGAEGGREEGRTGGGEKRGEKGRRQSEKGGAKKRRVQMAAAAVAVAAWTTGRNPGDFQMSYSCQSAPVYSTHCLMGKQSPPNVYIRAPW